MIPQEEARATMKETYDALTDPDKIEKSKCVAERKKRMEERKQDTGV